MTPTDDRRRRGALAALALGGFAVGLTEFVVMGLLPDIACDVLPGLTSHDASVGVAHAGWSITTYALGVVVGAPTIAVLGARVERRRLVIGLLAVFALGTALTALAPTFGLLLVARFVGGLPHGAYFGAAGMVAAALLGPGSQARGYALVLGGLTVSTLCGVPAVTALGQATSWRVAYLVVAGLFALAALAALATVPEVDARNAGDWRGELGALRTPQVWLTVLIGTVGFAGFFAAYSYIAPVTTHVADLPETTVPWVLVAAGAGMTAGNLLGGITADRDLRASLLGGFGALVVAVVAFALVARWATGLFVGAFAVGAAALFLAPALQVRLIGIASGARLMGAALNQSATNLANSIGAALGGLAIAHGLGYLSAAWVGVGLGAVGLALTALSLRLDRRSPAAPEPATAPDRVA